MGASNEMRVYPFFGRKNPRVLAQIPSIRPVIAITLESHAGLGLKLPVTHAEDGIVPPEHVLGRPHSPTSAPCGYPVGMYGLINVAVRDLVVAKFGQPAWDAILAKSEVDESAFIRMGQNDDAVTYALVGAASEVLDMPASDILQAFGQYWTEFTVEEGYGELLDGFGSTLPALVQNLDELHTRVALIYEGLRPPSFKCENVTDGSMDLHYISERDGLDDLVIGLLKGLGKRF